MKFISSLIPSGIVLAVLSSCHYSLPTNKLQTDTTGINIKHSVHTTVDTGLEEICTTKNVEWKPGNEESILLNPESDVIYPGSVLESSSIQSGEYTPITGNRLPITMSISLIRATLKAKIDTPTLSNVREGIKRILISKSEYLNPGEVTIHTDQVYSEEHLNLLLKGSYSGGFANVSSSFHWINSSIKSRFLISMTQIYYSLDVNGLGPKDFFSKQPATPIKFSPVYVSSVKYGRRIMLVVETNRNMDNKEATLNAEFSGFAASGTFSATAISQKLFDERSINIIVEGGSSPHAFEIFNAVSNKDSLYHIIAKDALFSSQSPGVPLAYTLRHCSDGKVFRVVQSGQYVARTCIIKPKDTAEYQPGDLGYSTGHPMCAVPDGGGDRDFAGNGPKVTFDLNLFHEGNQIYANIECHWKETDDNWTSGGYFNPKQLIYTLPDSLILDDILSPRKSTLVDVRLDGHGDHAFTKTDLQGGPIRSLTLIGDTDQDDDLWPGGCTDHQTQIKNISFYPISVSFHKRH